MYAVVAAIKNCATDLAYRFVIGFSSVSKNITNTSVQMANASIYIAVSISLSIISVAVNHSSFLA